MARQGRRLLITPQAGQELLLDVCTSLQPLFVLITGQCLGRAAQEIAPPWRT
jgi:hypothetical protein